MINILIFILILSILVLVHELGHFLAARRNGVYVEEFGFGLPPKVIGKKIGETIYSLNALPFGGFVKLLGEDEADATNYGKATSDTRNFISKTPWQKTQILVAGVCMNILLALFLYYIFFAVTGFRSFSIPNLYDYDFRFGEVDKSSTIVLSVGADSPAANSGIEVGEAVVSIDAIPVSNIEEIRQVLSDKAGTEVEIVLTDMRNSYDDQRTVTATPDANEDGRGVMGFYIGESIVLDYNKNKLSSAFLHSYNVLAFSKFTLGKIISSSFETRDIGPVSSSVAGPVGILSIVGGILDYSESAGAGMEKVKIAVLSLIDLTALLSLSLALINILPFPALDGGRLVFIIFEGVTKKRISPKIETALHQAGMVFLLAMLVLITIKDLRNLF